MKNIILTSFLFLIVFSVQSQIQVSKTEFSDNAQSYVGKKITVVDSWYSAVKNNGSYSEIKGLTLRSADATFEDRNSKNYPESGQSNSSQFYYRILEIDGIEVTLRIPKSLSDKMPNTTSSFVNVTGVVKSTTLIEVTSISRAE
jgi:hypothetical protein